MPTLDDQISTLQQRLQQLKLRQQRVDARKRALVAHRERQAQTRRKILLGALVLTKMEQGELDKGKLMAWLDEAVTRASDRSLFGLPPKPSPPDEISTATVPAGTHQDPRTPSDL